jgi:hypothetical protein
VSGDEIEERGLASAVGPDDGVHLAHLELKRDVARGDEAGERLPQAPYL